MPDVVAGVVRISIAMLEHGRNARGVLGDTKELAESMRRHGQQQPIIVEPAGEGRWSVFDGNRRLKAAREAKLPWLLAVARGKPLEERQRIVLQLSMHSAGRSFDPIAEARAIESLMFEHLQTREEIAAALGKSPGWVRDRLALLQLDEDEQRDVSRGVMSARQALAAVQARRNGHAAVAVREQRKAERLACSDRSCRCMCHRGGRS